MMITSFDPKVSDVARRYASHVVIATAGDPLYLPIGHIVVASGYAPGPMPVHHLQRCSVALSSGLAVVIAAPTKEVVDHGQEQVLAWCLSPGGAA